MSTPSSPGSTRQLLDELDALMQRMLELPVEPDDPASSTGAGGHVSAPTLSPPPVLASPPALELPAGLRLDRPDTPAAQNAEPTPVLAGMEAAWDRLAVGSEARLEAPAEGPTNLDRSPAADAGPFAELTTPAKVSPQRLAARPMPRRPPPAGSWLLAPLRLANLVFDQATRPLGGPGRWLRSNSGRAVLGWLGLGLLASAAAWQVLAWMGLAR